ncbi:MAG: nucleotidyltransferase family protein [Clostridia bacterium]|nr:nucleotidyltransferase family protein [Clostridia bacterium]
MKICAIICEYNPFHNGHKYLIAEAKRQSNADALLCLMSGNFTQRGEAAVLEKHLRAKHAVLSGADVVLELPTVFATSNAEIFAKGAVSLLSKIPAVQHLAFGAEFADKEVFLQAANALISEPQNVSSVVKALTKNGVGYAEAIATARSKVADERLFSSPNNILGIEYTKALLAQNSSIEILPIQRLGAGYHDEHAKDDFASATAIRNAMRKNELSTIEPYLPREVYSDLQSASEIRLDAFEKAAILRETPEKIAATLDCTEGLENAFLKAASGAITLEEALTSPRYTAARIRRIALQNLLNIQKDLVFECLENDLYLHPLAYKHDRVEILSTLSKASIPFLASGIQKSKLSATAAKCLAIDELAEKMYAALTGSEYENKTCII